MLTLFCRRGDRIVEEPFAPGQPQPAGVIWIDLLEPSPEEKQALKEMVGIAVPAPEDAREIEPSSRLYRDGHALFMTASVLHNTDSPHPETRAITFVLSNGMMTTIRYSSPTPFRTFRARIAANPEFCASPELALVELLDAIVDRAADILETADQDVNVLSKAIFAPVGASATRDYSKELSTIGIGAVRCSKVDESLVSLLRLITFFDANLRLAGNKDARGRLKDVHRDIVALIGYVERQSEKLQLLLDATLGMVNIQQNNIIKIFSVIAVVFLPPTLVASIYGMNFDLMPELKWHLGYPLALGLMFLSAVLPFRYFKYRGWL